MVSHFEGDSVRAPKGPLVGLRIIELGGVGPVPFCSMLLADLGAEVIKIDRPPGYDGGVPYDVRRFDLINRGRRSLALDLKNPDAVAALLKLASAADAVIEGFRPGVAERLGVGPEDCRAVNRRLVYGRMTGWGQQGAMAQEPGHDLNYISVTGALNAIGPASGPPAIPLNLVGDLGGGSLYLALGLLSAILEAQRSGEGQVVDAAMVDGSASLMTLFYGLRAAGYWTDERGRNRLDSGAPWYNIYRTKDGLWLSVAANEGRFWRNLLAMLDIAEADMPDQHDRDSWPAMYDRLARHFVMRSRDEWCRLAQGREVCLSPVLSMGEAMEHPDLRERGTFVEFDGVWQPGPAPRFSRTPGAIQAPPPRQGEHSVEVLRDWGFSETEIRHLQTSVAVV